MGREAVRLEGVGISGGAGLGRAVIVQETTLEVEKRRAEPQAEQERYRQAALDFCAEIESAAKAVAIRAGAEEAEILRAQVILVQDPALEKPVLDMVEREKVNVEYAFASVCDELIALFSAMDDELLSARAADFRDIKTRMLGILTGRQQVDLKHVPEGTVLVAEDITPSQSASINPLMIRGIVTKRGTRFAHISIIARALGIPAVAGVSGLLETVQEGDELLVDGDTGVVLLHPTSADRAEHEKVRAESEERHREMVRYRDLQARTVDGHAVSVLANLAVEQELPQLSVSGADGIGLYRTEFLYMERAAPPSEEEQYGHYRRAVEAMAGKPVIIRTLDVGGDKEIPCLGLEGEANPYLGLRAVRFCLRRREVFCDQVAALLRAGLYGELYVMVPMIISAEELREVRAFVQEVAARLRGKGVPCADTLSIGVMIETPAAVLCADLLAKEADFFSIGTNDLTQYTLAVDRGNAYVSDLYDPFHPAVLRMVYQTAQVARQAGIPVGICGEVAGDPAMVPFLMGCGLNELSVHGGMVAAVKKQICALSRQEWVGRIGEILSLENSAQVRRYLDDHYRGTAG